jgi:N-acetylglutamate synthase-like GNAT family acetyltransferase
MAGVSRVAALLGYQPRQRSGDERNSAALENIARAFLRHNGEPVNMTSLQQAYLLRAHSPAPLPPVGGMGIAGRDSDFQRGEIGFFSRALTEREWDKVRVFVRRTSRESLRLRFGQAADFGDERTLKRFIDIDGANGEMIWMLEEDGGICAMAHLVRLSPEQAEIGLIVRSDRVRQGIGERLLRLTLARAAQHDLKTLTALVLYENTAMLRLARKFGFEVRKSSGLTVELDLRPQPDRFGSCLCGHANRRDRSGRALVVHDSRSAAHAQKKSQRCRL